MAGDGVRATQRTSANRGGDGITWGDLKSGEIARERVRNSDHREGDEEK